MIFSVFKKIGDMARGRAVVMEKGDEGVEREVVEEVVKTGVTKKAEAARKYREKIKLDAERYAIYLEKKRARDRDRSRAERMKCDEGGVVEELKEEFAPVGIRGGRPTAYHRKKYRLKIRSNEEKHERVLKMNRDRAAVLREKRKKEERMKLREEILREMREEEEMIRRDVM